MQRLIEIILGLHKGFLSRQGEMRLEFNPMWLGAPTWTPVWNVVLGLLALSLVVYVYWREGRSRKSRITLGVLRGLLLAFVLFLLNQPVLTLGQTHSDPSIVAVLVDDSLSMNVPDAEAQRPGSTRMQAALDLLTGDNQTLLKQLARVHQLRFYRFDSDAKDLGAAITGEPVSGDKPAPEKEKPIDPSVLQAIASIEPNGSTTQVVPSLLTVLHDLQGQRLAGVVLITDGRDTPAQPLTEAFKLLKSYGVRVYPVAVGSENAPRNVEVQSVNVLESAFVGDIVNFKMTVRGTGYEPGHAVKLTLKDKKTGQPLKTEDGRLAEQTVQVQNDQPFEQELQFKPAAMGPLEIVAEVERQPGEIDYDDNIRTSQIAVLDARISVLYVDGYPRWEYRYIKNEMIRDKTVNVSCLLTSADLGFAQEGDPEDKAAGFPGAIKRFPESIEELMVYDVVLFGDVDPRQFTDQQLQLVSDFVSKKGGGFGMVAGPRWSPLAYRNSPIESIIPVNIGRVQPDPGGVITEGFRPTLTKEGGASSIFRFFADRAQNEKYIRDDLQPIFWYCQGVTAKPGVGEVYAEHPTDIAPDGRKAALLVLGRYGAGRTLFSGIDDSWRWRFYTGESIFDTYWVQQLRYLARSKKLGQRQLTFTSDRPAYVLGEQIRVSLRVLNPVLLQQLPAEISVEVRDENGQPVRSEKMQKQEGQGDLYAASFSADRMGKYSLHLPPITPEAAAMELLLPVIVPRLELAEPQVNRSLLSRVAQDTGGQAVEYAQARARLPELIQSAAVIRWVPTSEPLWNAPLAMVIFVLLITIEWVIRKAYGLL